MLKCDVEFWQDALAHWQSIHWNQTNGFLDCYWYFWAYLCHQLHSTVLRSCRENTCIRNFNKSGHFTKDKESLYQVPLTTWIPWAVLVVSLVKAAHWMLSNIHNSTISEEELWHHSMRHLFRTVNLRKWGLYSSQISKRGFCTECFLREQQTFPDDRIFVTFFL